MHCPATQETTSPVQDPATDRNEEQTATTAAPARHGTTHQASHPLPPTRQSRHPRSERLMGMSPVGKLIYGYALGGTEDGPLIAEVNEEGEWQTPWAIKLATDPDREHEDPEPFGHLVTVLKDGGMNAGDQYTDGVTIFVTNHGHLEYGHCYALVTFECETEWSDVKPVDLTALETRRKQEGWDELLAQAIEILGITPVELQKKDGNRWDPDAPRVPVPPRWMVVAQYI